MPLAMSSNSSKIRMGYNKAKGTYLSAVLLGSLRDKHINLFFIQIFPFFPHGKQLLRVVLILSF